MLPRIDIKYGRFLDPIFKKVVALEYSDIEIPTLELVNERVKTYRAIWNEVGDRILAGMTQTLGLEFKRNHIPVYVVSLSSRDFSSPLVLKSRYARGQFINAITHELIHCLCADNDGSNYKEPYPDNRHIIVYAAMKFIFLDVLKDESLVSEAISTIYESAFSEKNKEYQSAWEYVDQKGYIKILSEFRDLN